MDTELTLLPLSITVVCVSVDLDNLTDDSYEPRASLSQPLVLPLGGSMDIHCRVPNGRPTPSQRYTVAPHVVHVATIVYTMWA